MKKRLLFFSIFLAPFSALLAQTAFWTEDFGTGCNRGQSPVAFLSVNGAWTQTNTGTNDAYADLWFVSATASGTGGGNCSESCLFQSTTNQSLHIGNAAISFINFGMDTGSTYLTGVFCGSGICSTTHKRVESPVINCLAKSNIIASFTYYEGGEGTDDDATFWFSPDAGVTWQQIDPLPKTTVGPCSAPSASWVEYSVAFPATADNNANVKFGILWTNDNDGQGADPSFAIDDITLLYSPLGISSVVASSVDVFAVSASQVQIAAKGQDYKVNGVYDMFGREVKFEQTENALQLSDAAPGIYVVSLDVQGVRVTKKLLLGQ